MSWSIIFSDNLVQNSQQFLQRAPNNWLVLDYSSLENLEQITRQYPDFAPGWFFLARKYESQGKIDQAHKAAASYDTARAKEKI